jgi:hypothetical protein
LGPEGCLVLKAYRVQRGNRSASALLPTSCPHQAMATYAPLIKLRGLSAGLLAAFGKHGHGNAQSLLIAFERDLLCPL